MNTRTPLAQPLALTMGEPAGIGGEITLKAWEERQRRSLPPFLVLDDPQRLERLASALRRPVPIRAKAVARLERGMRQVGIEQPSVPRSAAENRTPVTSARAAVT